MKKVLIVLICGALAVLLLLPLIDFIKDVGLAVSPLTIDGSSTGVNQNNPVTTSAVSLTMAEVAKHNQAKDCWMVIGGNVYDLSSYVGYHPGGATMIPDCGTEATNSYNTKGGRGQAHSSAASQLLNNYLLGKLGDTIAPSTAGNPPTPPIPAGQLEYEDD